MLSFLLKHQNFSFDLPIPTPQEKTPLTNQTKKLLEIHQSEAEFLTNPNAVSMPLLPINFSY